MRPHTLSFSEDEYTGCQKAAALLVFTWRSRRVGSACREASEALVALSVLVYERTGSGLITAAVYALTFLPVRQCGAGPAG
jgi:hypothetical protein